MWQAESQSGISWLAGPGAVGQSNSRRVFRDTPHLRGKHMSLSVRGLRGAGTDVSLS